mmetsp:Transcript_10748/g.48449  ORF Transcript_10748/g.48449 Transcript_10748/m.48449 type:complete len:245 (-) Transcript_10748:3360-4094(-)
MDAAQLRNVQGREGHRRPGAARLRGAARGPARARRVRRSRCGCRHEDRHQGVRRRLGLARNRRRQPPRQPSRADASGREGRRPRRHREGPRRRRRRRRRARGAPTPLLPHLGGSQLQVHPPDARPDRLGRGQAHPPRDAPRLGGAGRPRAALGGGSRAHQPPRHRRARVRGDPPERRRVRRFRRRGDGPGRGSRRRSPRLRRGLAQGQVRRGPTPGHRDGVPRAPAAGAGAGRIRARDGRGGPG